MRPVGGRSSPERDDLVEVFPEGLVQLAHGHVVAALGSAEDAPEAFVEGPAVGCGEDDAELFNELVGASELAVRVGRAAGRHEAYRARVVAIEAARAASRSDPRHASRAHRCRSRGVAGAPRRAAFARASVSLIVSRRLGSEAPAESSTRPPHSHRRQSLRGSPAPSAPQDGRAAPATTPGTPATTSYPGTSSVLGASPSCYVALARGKA